MAKKQKLQELKPDDPCGCGSGELYAHCHKLTAVKYFKDESGAISHQIPISDELKTIIEVADARFKNIFGRKQRGDEPILFEKFLVGKEPRLFQAALKVANLAGIDEELIYAWRKTGLIVAEQNLHLISNVDRKEWQRSIQEYRRIRRKGLNPFYKFTYLTGKEFDSLTRIKALIKEIISVGDLALDKISSSITIESHVDKKLFILLSYNTVLYAITTIITIIEERYSDDCLSVGRGIFEQYLRCKALRVGSLAPEAIFCASLASHGILQFATRKNGKNDYSKVINFDNKIVDVSINYSELAKNSGDSYDYYLYDILYRDLSNYVHRDVSYALINTLMDRELSLDLIDDEVAGPYTIAVLIFLFFEEITKNDWVKGLPRRDILYKLNELERHLNIVSKNKEIRSGRVPLVFK